MYWFRLNLILKNLTSAQIRCRRLKNYQTKTDEHPVVINVRTWSNGFPGLWSAYCGINLGS